MSSNDEVKKTVDKLRTRVRELELQLEGKSKPKKKRYYFELQLEDVWNISAALRITKACQEAGWASERRKRSIEDTEKAFDNQRIPQIMENNEAPQWDHMAAL